MGKNNKKHTVIITESLADEIHENLKMTEYKFYSSLKHFLVSLMHDPVNAEVPFVLESNGLTRSKLIKLLLSNGIIEREQRISDKDENGEFKTATMFVKYKVPKRGFNRKLKRLFIRLFEKNVPEKVNEDGEGATSCDASSGQFSQPLFSKPISRNIYAVDEDTENSDYQYTVPFPGDNETLKRKNGVGGSVSVNFK